MFILYLSIISLFVLFSLVYSRIYRYFLRIFSKKSEKLIFGIVLSSLFFIGILITIDKISLLHDSSLKEIDNSILAIFYVLISWLISHFFNEQDISSFLRAKKENDKEITFRNLPNLKKVSEVKNFQIATYPRLTLCEIKRHMNRDIKKTIFDSSDFELVNKMNGTLEGLNRNKSFSKNRDVLFNDKIYEIENLQVIYDSFFNDYIFYGNSKPNSGKDIPYNIHIIVELKEITGEPL